MKIKIFDSVSDHYGSSRICQIIKQIMCKSGHDVQTFVGIERLTNSQQYGEVVELPLLVMKELRETPLSYLKELFVFSFNFYKKKFYLFEGADLIYCNTIGTLPVALISKLYGFRTVLHLHETSTHFFMSSVGKFVFPLVSDYIICVSEDVARSWKINAHSKTRIVHNGIHDCELKFITDTRPYDICFVGRLTEKKGIELFLDALEVIKRNFAQDLKDALRVIIAGGPLPGHEVPSRLQNIENKNDTIQITYVGEVEGCEDIFLQSKVACVPSLFRDPFPTVVLEAMRAGCVVVASEIGGAREALACAHGELIAPNDVTALAEAMIRQVNLWNLDYARHNNKLFSNNFSLSKFEERFISSGIFEI